MDNIQPPVELIPPAQIPVVPSKPLQSWKIILLVIITIILTAGATAFFFKGSTNPPVSQTKPTTIPLPSVTPQTTTPTTDMTGWKTYTDKEAGFTLKYPPEVLFNEETRGTSKLLLTTSVQLLSDIPEDLPRFMGRKDALAEKESLKTGGGNTIKIGTLYASVSTELTGLDQCTIYFVRKITFYPGNYKVVIALTGPKETIFTDMPDFFTTNPPNCGNKPYWKDDKIITFDEILAKKEGRGMAQKWFDTSMEIAGTITLSSDVTVKISPTNKPIITPNASSCDVTDNAFCNVLTDLKNSLKTQDYAGFLSYQNIQSVTCDPDGMFVSICEGVAKGVLKEGYAIGYNGSEGTILIKNDYVKTITSYINSNGPFVYHGSLVSGNKGTAVFLNPKKDHILVFPMHREGLTWRMDSLLLGVDNDKYSNITEDILN